jgi:hypothetical protein
VSKLGNLAGKRFWTSSTAQHHFMASRQGFPRERKRDCAGADRSELHDAASSFFERSENDAGPACLTDTRDGVVQARTNG